MAGGSRRGPAVINSWSRRGNAVLSSRSRRRPVAVPQWSRRGLLVVSRPSRRRLAVVSSWAGTVLFATGLKVPVETEQHVLSCNCSKGGSGAEQGGN